MLLLIDNLPGNSAFIEAQLNDPDLVAQLIDNQKDDDEPDKKKSTIRVRDYSSELRAMASVHDQLARLNSSFIGANSKPGRRPPKPNYYDRPKTLLDKMKSERKLREHESLVARVLPGKRK